MPKTQSTQKNSPARNQTQINSVAIFANPKAGRGKGREFARRLRIELRKSNIRAHIIHLSPSTAEESEIQPADAIITIGGDGTLRAAAARCLEILGHVPPLLPVPMGTANLMCRHLGVDSLRPNAIQQITASLQRGKLNWFDAAKCNDRLFLLMVGVGLDGMIVHELDRIRSGPIHYASYILPAAMAIGGYQYPPLEVSIDGKKVFSSAPAFAFVGNVKEYGTGFPLLPNARPDDGLLDVCVIPVENPLDVVRQFLHAAAGEHTLGEGVLHSRGKVIEIRSPKSVPVQADGDPAGHTPVRIELLPIQVPFVMPV
jgi:YegS/Rv2252/BmrU family lipid kinase